MPPDSLCNTSVAVHKTEAFCIPALHQETSQEAGLVRSFLPKPKPHAKLLLQPTAAMDRPGGRRANRAPSKQDQANSPNPAERRAGSPRQGTREHLRSLVLSSGESFTCWQPHTNTAARLEGNPFSFLCSPSSQDERTHQEKHFCSSIPSAGSLPEETRARAHTHTHTTNTLGVRTALGGGNPKNESTLPHR